MQLPKTGMRVTPGCPCAACSFSRVCEAVAELEETASEVDTFYLSIALSTAGRMFLATAEGQLQQLN